MSEYDKYPTWVAATIAFCVLAFWLVAFYVLAHFAIKYW